MKIDINKSFSNAILKLAADETPEDPAPNPGASLDLLIQRKLRDASQQAKLLKALFSKYADDPDINECLSAILQDISYVQKGLRI